MSALTSLEESSFIKNGNDFMLESSVVSIIIPTHNRKGYLEEAIQSVFSQTYKHWEIIVVDDASDDGTWEWLEKQTNERFRCLRLKGNSGSTITRNAGLRVARGEYILFLDDDDLLPEDALAIHMDGIQRQRDLIATAGSVYAFDKNGFLSRIKSTTNRKIHHNIWRDVQFWWPFMVGASLFRTSIIREVGGFDEALEFWGDDVDLWLRIGHLGPVALLPSDVIKWRHHGQKRPDDFYEFLTEIGSRHAETWSNERRAIADNIHGARSALWELRRKSGQSGNLIRMTRLFGRIASCPYLIKSPISRGEIWRAIHRDLATDAWLKGIKKVLRRD